MYTNMFMKTLMALCCIAALAGCGDDSHAQQSGKADKSGHGHSHD